MLSKTGKMIKLRLSFEVSFGKVILGVAGISATICAFQYFNSRKSELKGFSKNEVVQYKSDSKKDNKLPNIIPAKPDIVPKLSKDKSSKDDLSSSKPENGIYSNKVKGYISSCDKTFRKRSDCKGDYNSKWEKSISKSDLNCKGPISENEPYKANINEVNSCQLKDERIKVTDKNVLIGANVSTSNDDLQTDEKTSKVDIKMKPVNEVIQEKLNNERKNVLETSLETDSNTSNDYLQIVEENLK